MAKNAIPFFVVWVDSSVEYKQINYEISMGMAIIKCFIREYSGILTGCAKAVK